MMKHLFALLFVALLLGCATNDLDENSKVEIRLSNVSTFDFQDVVVNTSTGNVEFDNVLAGEKSDFKTFETAYAYAYVELKIDGQTYTLQPIDYVGEEPLKNGKYTYQIDANESQDQYGKLRLTLVEE